MDWNAKAAWVYKDSFPDFPKCAKRGIKVIYIDPRSVTAKSIVTAIRKNGLIPGAYFADSWSNATGAQFADYISTVLNDILPKGELAEAPPCMLDIERQSVTWQITCIERYRKHQPNRPTSYTNAPFQGGYVPVQHLIEHKMPLYVQLYYGGMAPADASAALLEQLRGGMPPGMVHPFYDGKSYSSDQRDGAYFTLERMPG